jgi:NAD(P)-dependent dehydrogenase (short-subunit alcohol dehydrogenase family)
MEKEFASQVAIVTGGSAGLGKAMASQLAKNGATVVIASRKMENLQAAYDEISQFGGKVAIQQTDVREYEQVEALIKRTVDEFGRIDILINNAAGNFAVQSEKLTPNGWNAVVGIVLNGTWYCSSLAGRQMIEQKSGCILNVIATYAWTGAPGVVHSASAKAGVLAMTRTLAAEWGHYGIRVNAFAPGPMDTEAASKNLLFADKKVQETIAKRIPLQRFLPVEEAAEAALFLCSKKASYITGDVMTADGGAWLGRGFFDFTEALKQQGVTK